MSFSLLLPLSTLSAPSYLFHNYGANSSFLHRTTNLFHSFPKSTSKVSRRCFNSLSTGEWRVHKDIGGTFLFSFQVSPIYPHEVPKVKCKTKVYHPNIDLEGNVYLNILCEDWKPVVNINTVNYGLFRLVTEPNYEDPLVTTKYAVAYARGLQGDSFNGGRLGQRLQASACGKHFTAYELDHWKGLDGFVFNARVTLQGLADTYQPPFQSCIQQGRASGIMCAYNRVNRVPNYADLSLLTGITRNKWNFHGYITSDCGAVSTIHEEQGYAKTTEDALADVRKAG